MSVMEILDALLLGPLELLFEVIFVVTDRLINNPAASIEIWKESCKKVWIISKKPLAEMSGC